MPDSPFVTLCRRMPRTLKYLLYSWLSAKPRAYQLQPHSGDTNHVNHAQIRYVFGLYTYLLGMFYVIYTYANLVILHVRWQHNEYHYEMVDGHISCQY